MSDPKPVTDRGAYIDKVVDEKVRGAADNANSTLQKRDSQAAQEKETKESVGTGRDNSDENKRILLQQMEARAQAYEKQGKSAKAAETRARMKQLEEM